MDIVSLKFNNVLLAQDAEDEDVDRLVVNEDMVITAMMMELCGCV